MVKIIEEKKNKQRKEEIKNKRKSLWGRKIRKCDAVFGVDTSLIKEIIKK